uniref:Protein MAINTENANCE OF PSII UNDER HIGH LIGHT 1 n=1 Tax=Anthurium amnicola TaxID=1678845 RepID=A0A1D1ZFF1_9ARAE
MACATQSMISASSCAFPSHGHRTFHTSRRVKGHGRVFTVGASAADPEESDCNVEECAPEKEVGKVSVEWLAEEKTRVVGTYPPRKKSWTGYIEKDTAGQTNIYSVEPTVYVAESAISSGSAGTSAEGAENTVAIVVGLALVSVAAASSILILVGKNPPQVQTTEYSGPPLSYYINKFKPANIVEAAIPLEPRSSPAVQSESSPQVLPVEEAPQFQVELNNQLNGQTQDLSSSS